MVVTVGAVVSTYAVVKINGSTQQVVAVIANGMQYHHADRLAAELCPRVETGFYIKAVNDRELP